METTEAWPAWGRLIDDARERLGLSQNAAAERAGMSGTRWRQVVSGSAGQMASPRGVKTVVRMAQLVAVTPQQLEAAGRPDVAEELRSMQHPPQLGDDFDERIARIKANPAARQRLLDLLRAARLPEADEDDERDRRSDAG